MMKKCYMAPELELVHYSMMDILVVSPTEESLTDTDIGGGSGAGHDFGDLTDDDLN